MFSVSSIHLVMDCNLPFIHSNVFVLVYFHSSTVKFELLIPQNFFPETSLTFLCLLCFLTLVIWGLLFWLNYLPDSISFLPAIAIINDGLCRCLFLFCRFFCFCFCSGYTYSVTLPLVIIYLSNYLFVELLLHPTTDYFGFSFTSCFWLKMLFSDHLD